MRDFSSDLKDLRRRLGEAYSYLNVETGRARLVELEAAISAPDLWDDQDRAKKVNAEYANLKGDLGEYDALAASIDDSEVLAELERRTDQALEEHRDQDRASAERTAEQELQRAALTLP